MHTKLNIKLASLVLTAVLLAPNALQAAESDDAMAERLQAEEAELRQRREEILAEIERTRLEAERAAQEAREKAEQLRAETQRMRAEQREHAHEASRDQEAHQREIERTRRELSRTHRELQRASQEVARAHRDLALAEEQRVRATMINLGDRPMIGVILGEQNEDGIRIIGLSPDGPAERAGLRKGDVLTSLRGERLGGAAEGAAREIVYEVLNEVEDGEEIRVEVLRDGQSLDFMLKPEKREPANWASFIRLPEPPAVVADIPGAPDAPLPPHALEAQIVIPSIDAAELAAQAEIMAEQFEAFRAVIHEGDGNWSMAFGDGHDFEQFEFEFDAESMAKLSERALGEASIWLGSPATFGVRFAELNEGLGQYFGTNQGVLVLEASRDNALKLQPGDVVQSIGDDRVSETSDVVRALRGYEAGEQVRIAIRRQQRDESLEVVMPQNRLGP